MISDQKGSLKEIAINSAVNWKNAFSRVRKNGTQEGKSFDSADAVDWDDPEDPWVILHNHIQDMVTLWNSPNIKKLMGKQSGRIEDISG